MVRANELQSRDTHDTAESAHGFDARIAELEHLRAGLTQRIGCGCLSLKQCQLANPADMPRAWGRAHTI